MSSTTVGRLLHRMGYRLQSVRKQREARETAAGVSLSCSAAAASEAWESSGRKVEAMTEDAGNDASVGNPEGLQPAVEHSTRSKACAACCSPIPVDATLCSECGSHQTPWLKNLLILARVSGLIAVTVAGATYAVTTYETVRKALAWRNEIVLVDYNSGGSITITNRSDGPVFVTSMDVRAVTEEGESFYEFSVAVNKRIELQDFVSFDQPQENRFKDYIVDSTFVQGEDPDDALGYLARGLDPDNRCYKAAFFYEGNSRYKQVRGFLDHLLVYRNVSASITYHTVRGEEIQTDQIAVVATILRSKECEPRLIDVREAGEAVSIEAGISQQTATVEGASRFFRIEGDGGSYEITATGSDGFDPVLYLNERRGDILVTLEENDNCSPEDRASCLRDVTLMDGATYFIEVEPLDADGDFTLLVERIQRQ